MRIKKRQKLIVEKQQCLLELTDLIKFAKNKTLQEVLEKVKEIPARYIMEEYINPMHLRQYNYLDNLLERWKIAASVNIIYGKGLDRYYFAYVQNVKLLTLDIEESREWREIFDAIGDNLPLVAKRYISEILFAWDEKFHE